MPYLVTGQVSCMLHKENACRLIYHWLKMVDTFMGKYDTIYHNITMLRKGNGIYYISNAGQQVNNLAQHKSDSVRFGLMNSYYFEVDNKAKIRAV